MTLFPENKIYCGDNLEIMRSMPDESIDLIYLDPPFFSNRYYEVIWGDNQELRSFGDLNKSFSEKLGRELTAEEKAYEERNSGGIAHYMGWMKDRLIEMHRILKPIGSIYLHCDWHASHYLKVEMDKIFGYGNFKNEIIWKRTYSAKTSQYENKKFSVLTDSIFFYSKSDDYKFNFDEVRRQLSEEELYEKYNKEDELGKYRLGPILRSASMGERPNLCYEFEGFKPKKWGWRLSLDKLKEVATNGNLGWTKNKTPFRKHRMEEERGEAIFNIWDDIQRVGGEEALGYPTQKPEALLERIIKASSNPGDIVLDPFCGCGTALAVADRLNRRFVGIDISPKACTVIVNRLHYSTTEIIGMPTSTTDLSKMEPHEFQQWVCDKMLAKNTSHSKTKPSGGDGGKDGIILSNLNTGKYGGTPVQIKKSDGVGVNVIKNLFATMYDMGHIKKGFVVGLSFSSGAVEQVAKYKLEDSVDIKLIKAEELCNVPHYDFHKKAIQKLEA